ncbi:MAG: tRNA threonylcarbamoyladenosine dehydratase [Fibrobacter sp.]|nr:tRNA threonylcarbamoyladenosine dehydratase [Fibrobacter sp.]
MSERLQRIELLMGTEALDRLGNLRVAIFGVGGVGSVCAESLIRSGVKHLTLVDSDCVVESNINRQLPALSSTLGKPKVNVLANRFADINPDANVTPIQARYECGHGVMPTDGSASDFRFENYDVVVDAIDSLAHKIDLLARAHEVGCKVYCSLGAARKLDPTKVRSASIWETHGCPLGKLVRNGLRKRGFSGDFMAVYSEEKFQSFAPTQSLEKCPLGSAMPVTATFGLTLSSLVIRSCLTTF